MNFSWLLPEGKGIPVLMYHKVWPGCNDDLTITPEKLREQWSYLKQEGYHPLSLTDYLEIAHGMKAAPARAMLITFDDGYQNNQVYVYPLLRELGWQATFFIIGNTLDETHKNESGPEQKMTWGELRMLDPAVVQLGMHGYAHENMGSAGPDKMEAELGAMVNAFKSSGLPFHMVFAYPYGARPGSKVMLATLKRQMAEMGITAAFRIGNRVSNVPAEDIFEVKRIDIKGTDTMNAFKIKLKKGKLKPF